MGFVPVPQIELQSGLLYNLIVDLLVGIACSAAAYLIYPRLRNKAFPIFLFLVGSYWLVAGLGNLLAWFNLLKGFDFIAYILKPLMAVPAVVLIYYLLSEVFADKTTVHRLTAVFFALALGFVFISYRIDGTAFLITYWGVQWQNLPASLYIWGALFPIGLAALYLVIKEMVFGIFRRQPVDMTIFLSALIYAFLEYVQVTSGAVTWPRLLARLFYILIAFGAYLYFVGKGEEEKFVPRTEKAEAKPKPRVSFFLKLLFLFVFLAVIPITISSLLMFISFKEIIDLFIYKPLLWNLKTSREAFLLALTHVQIQAMFLMILTGLLVMVASIAVSRGIAGSLRRISLAMARVSRGDFSFRLLPDSNDEIGDVVNYFNDMSLEIKRARDLMENWNRELEQKVRERTEDLQTLFDVARAIGSSLDLELLIRRTMEIMSVKNYAFLKPDGSVRFAAGPEESRKNAVNVPIKAKGVVSGTLVIEPGRELERNKHLLATISDQLAIAIENVGIYEKEKEAVARLTELDRLKNEFISMVSHELRTPVTSADGYVSLFLAGVAGPMTDDQKKYLTIVKENNQRLLTLINRLLDFSRIETGRFSIQRELISINDIVNTAVEMMRPQLEKKQGKLVLKLEARNVNFMGDREKMQEVFINLIENALKFARDDSPLEIVIRTRDAENFIEVAVSDNGIGIEKQYLEMVFNKFFQIEDAMTRKAGGVGLGLALAREIIGNHHGKIWAESEGKGKGSRFIFNIPVAEKA